MTGSIPFHESFDPIWVYATIHTDTIHVAPKLAKFETCVIVEKRKGNDFLFFRQETDSRIPNKNIKIRFNQFKNLKSPKALSSNNLQWFQPLVALCSVQGVLLIFQWLVFFHEVRFGKKKEVIKFCDSLI